MTRRFPGLSVVAGSWLSLTLWALLSHPGDRGRIDTVTALVLAALGFVVAAAMGSVVRWLPGLVVAACTAAVVALAGSAAWTGGPLAPPLGYGNANGMLVVGAVAGVLVSGSSTRSPWPRLLAPVVAVGGLVAAYEMRAKAALLACALLLLWYVVHRAGRSTTWVTLSVVGTAASWAAIVWWGLRPDRAPRAVVSVLSEERIALWRDAIRITWDHPVIGAGPGRFPRLSPTAQDPDLAWTHSTPLQLSAELGLVGAGLFALLVLALLLTSGRWAAVSAIVLLPTSIDYVLDFPSVLVLVAGVAGASWAAAGSDGRDSGSAGARSPGDGKPVFTPPAP